MPSSRKVALDWGENQRISKDDWTDFHLDLGCGTAKKGRIGLDKIPGEGVDVVHDLASGGTLPFDDASIDSIIASHVLEHIGENFIALMADCSRVLRSGGLFRIIVPLFPTRAAVIDPDHKRFFCAGSFDYFTSQQPGFQKPYIENPFTKTDEVCSPPSDWGEMRVSLRKP